MAYIKNIIYVTALATCTAANVASAREDDLHTFAGAELELALAADDGETTVNNLDALTGDERAEVTRSFRVVRLHGRTLLGEGFYLIGSDGTIEKFVTADEYRDVIIPSKKGDCYLVCSGSCPTAFHFPYFPRVKTLYTVEGIKKWSHEVYGYVHASDDLSLVGVFFPESYSEKNPNIRIIDKNGNLKNNHRPGTGYPWFVSRDGEKIIIPEYGGMLPANAKKGTRVFNKKGKLLFTLSPNYLCHFGPGDGLKLYCSENLIVQVCQKVEREKVTSDTYDPEIRGREEKVEKPGYYIQVYDGTGLLKWQKFFDESPYFGSFGVSDNDRFLLIYVPGDLPRCEILSTETGTLEYLIAMPDALSSSYAESALSNDGRKCCVVLRKFGNKEPFPGKSRALLFEDGNKIAEFEKAYNIHEPSSGRYHAEFSAEGRYVSVSCDNSFRIYRIKIAR